MRRDPRSAMTSRWTLWWMFQRRPVTSTLRKHADWSPSWCQVSDLSRSVQLCPRRLAHSSSHNLRGRKNLSGLSGVWMRRQQQQLLSRHTRVVRQEEEFYFLFILFIFF